MSMVPFNGDPLQALKWQENNATKLQALIQAKADWYTKYNTTFWGDWQKNVFDLRTASPFGLMVWCIILGVPSQLFGLYPNNNAWAYGANRQNYIYSGALPAPASANTDGGNFAGGGNTTVLNLDDVRHALQLRYATLISNGSLQFINEMLRYIFNDGEDWDIAAGHWFYVVDSTVASGPLSVAAIYRSDWQGLQLLSATARTNIYLQSVDLTNAAWSKQRASLAAITGPDGISQASTFTATGLGGTYEYQSMPVVTGQQYPISVFARAGSISTVSIHSFSPSGDAAFNLVGAGSVGPVTGVMSNGQIVALGGGWYQCTATLTATTTGSINIAPVYFNPSVVGDTASFFGPMFGATPTSGGSYIPTTTAPATATDYALTSVGQATLANPPAVGAALTWSGSYKQQTTANQNFGTGNGSQTVFMLSDPLGAVDPVTQPLYMEYRIGPNMGISGQFLTLMNSPQYGIVPSCAGTKYTVIQE